MKSLYKKKLIPYILIVIFVVFSTFSLWLPFLANLKEFWGIKLPQGGFEVIEANWDGPLYIISTKTSYNPNNEIFIDPPLGLSAQYYAAHLPLYPLTIKIVANVMSYPKAMLISTLLASALLFCLFYFFIKKHSLTGHPLLLTTLLMFWPRLLIVRSIGSPEPLFLLLVLVSVFLFIEKRFFLASLFGALSVVTKTPGVILFPACGLYFIYDYFKTKKISLSSLWIILIPLSLLGVFQFYNIQLNDFFAYYHTGAVVPITRLFAMFNQNAKWVGTAWLEDIVFIFLLLLSAALVAITNKQKEISPKLMIIGFFMITFLFSLGFVEHRDISRYSLPIVPFAFISLEKFFTDKRFLVACCLVLPAIYLYAINFIASNAAPITNWLPFM